MAKKDFDFDFLTFEEGVSRVNTAIEGVGLKPGAFLSKIVTSQDPTGKKLEEALTVDKVPDNYDKWQLPVYWVGTGAQFFITVIPPGENIPSHSHDEGPGIRFIIQGSIEYDGQELHSGDWMFCQCQ